VGRKPRVGHSREEKWQIVQEGIKSGNVSEMCRRHGIAPNLFYRWRDDISSSLPKSCGYALVVATRKYSDRCMAATLECRYMR
jgi:transposase-like protein